MGSDPPANADRAREGAGARDAPKVVRLREGTPPSKAFLRRTFEAFRASYPKSVPDDPAMKSLWAEHCRDDDSFKAIMDGLAAWKESRRWKKDGNDFVRKPRTFLEEQEYLSPPLPWSGDGAPPDPAGNGKEGTDAEHRGDRGRAAGAAAAAERVYAGDIHDPYWREHGGQLLNQPRRRAAT